MVELRLRKGCVATCKTKQEKAFFMPPPPSPPPHLDDEDGIDFLPLPKGQSGSSKQIFSNISTYKNMNFLYQAAHLVQANKCSTSTVEGAASSDSNSGSTHPLTHYYNFMMKKTAQKNVQRISPHIKRTVCKHCHALLIAGETCDYKMLGNREKHIVVSCSACGAQKRYLLRDAVTTSLFPHGAPVVISSCSQQQNSSDSAMQVDTVEEGNS